MDNKEKRKYRKENRKKRRILLLYGSKIFGLPHLYKLRNRAFKKAFGIVNPAFIGNNLSIIREHGQVGGMKIGENVVLSDNIVIDYTGTIIVGDNVHISSGVKIYSHNHDCYSITHGKSVPLVETTSIGNNCWIGANAIILPGVKIGNYSVIGAGSIVTHDVPDNTLVAGNPARIIRSITENGI